eukprot:gnl/Carplike_NY0171/6291_a8643_258.p1 GENE.gnl/Carplike_NY0171/6291_a8643_258~~gnl/Carplike_NY0171/6291_a8643_258.p1  ORF type:complete len:107 (+),score=9.83 gnl/Carplike_NY0171/6291_a8643_258:82-402(+)
MPYKDITCEKLIANQAIEKALYEFGFPKEELDKKSDEYAITAIKDFLFKELRSIMDLVGEACPNKKSFSRVLKEIFFSSEMTIQASEKIKTKTKPPKKAKKRHEKK